MWQEVLVGVTATVLGGTIVFVSGQLLVKFLVEPLHAQGKLIGEISAGLILYGNVSKQMPARAEEASQVWREQASELMGRTHAIPWYGLWRLVFRRPSEENLIKASAALIGLSNTSFRSQGRTTHRDEVIKRLGLSAMAKRFGIERPRPWWQFWRR